MRGEEEQRGRRATGQHTGIVWRKQKKSSVREVEWSII